jgi:RNA polymerase sigma factor (TIGR02999 family)
MTAASRLFEAAAAGDSRATAELLPLVYSELRKLAKAQLTGERAGHTLQPTALVHEVYLRLIGDATSANWAGRGHFFGAAAEAMRRILIESARRKKSLKRGGNRERLDVDDVPILAAAPSDELLALDEAIEKLTAEHPRKAELIKLRYFAGLNIDEAARVLGISPATAKRDWNYARAWLFHEIIGK